MFTPSFRLLLRAAALAALLPCAGPANALPIAFEAFCIGMLGRHLGEKLDIVDCLLESQPGYPVSRGDPSIPPVNPRERDIDELSKLSCRSLEALIRSTKTKIRHNRELIRSYEYALGPLLEAVQKPTEEAALLSEWEKTRSACSAARDAVSQALMRALQGCGSPDASERMSCRIDAADSIPPDLIAERSRACAVERRAYQAYAAEASRAGAIRQAINDMTKGIADMRAHLPTLETLLLELEQDFADRRSHGECR